MDSIPGDDHGLGEDLTNTHTLEPDSKSANLTTAHPVDEEASSFHFGLASVVPPKNDLGTLRPDKVSSFSHIRRATPEENEARSSIGSDKMIIRRTTEWDVHEDYEVPASDLGTLRADSRERDTGVAAGACASRVASGSRTASVDT